MPRGLGKQAKVLSKQELSQLLDHVARGRNPERDRCAILLSFRAGLRVKEICALTWAMVTTVSGAIGSTIELPNVASKGNSGRVIPIHPELREALEVLHAFSGDEEAVIYAARRRFQRPNTLAVWFWTQYKQLRMSGASSHSGRRTFITQAARSITAAGGSLRDVQDLAGHASLNMTQRYIEISDEAKRRVVESM